MDKVYEVFGELDTELQQYCVLHHIKYITNTKDKTIKFIASEEKLEKLHNDFFDEYSFELK